METFTNALSWQYGLVSIIVYFATLSFYRLLLHPLARFPGPKLAAITRYYEAYYDIIKNGQYTFKIAELHAKYGPIVRISPYELHVNDPAFYDTLYRQDARFDKYDWAIDAFAAKGATIFTASHDLHKTRRQPLNPFFSKAKVASRQDLIRHHLKKYCDRILKIAESGKTFDLGAATTALVRDVGNDYILGKCDNSLDKEDFDVALLDVNQGSGNFWRITKHVRWFAPTIRAIPIDIVIKTAGGNIKYFFRIIKETGEYTKELMAAETSSDSSDKAKPNVVHEIMNSKLPPSEKTFDRVFNDTSLITGAAFETTASVLRMIFFHVYSNVKILQTLRAELVSAEITSMDVKALEQLPYLTAILMEGLRLSPGIASRMARIAPHEIFYGPWRIPAGTPVGMTTILMHTDETVYPESKLFKPERWMDPDARKKAEKTFAPFSKGPRNCLGMHLAWAELYLCVAELAQRFDFRFEGVAAKDFECNSDEFAIGTNAMGHLKASVTIHRA